MDKRQQKHRSREIRRRILTWVGMAKEPLRVDELAFACAVGDGEEKIDLAQRLLYSEQDLWAKCGPLVEIVDGVVQYSHLSVREYLFRSRSGDYWVQEENAHASIALTSSKIPLSFSAVSCISSVVHPGLEDSSPVRTWTRLGSSRQETRAESSPELSGCPCTLPVSFETTKQKSNTRHLNINTVDLFPLAMYLLHL